MSSAEESKKEEAPAKPEEVPAKPEEAPAKAEEVAAKTETTSTTTDTTEPTKESKENDADAAAAEETKAAKKKVDDAELTKRLQKLALERQKESKHDRLKVIQSDTGSALSSVKSFQELNLPKHLLDALFAMGFDRPSAIQEEALPRILADPPRNLIGQAQSGRYAQKIILLLEAS